MRFRLANTAGVAFAYAFHGLGGARYMPFAVVMYLGLAACRLSLACHASVTWRTRTSLNKAIGPQLALAFLGLSILLWPALGT